MPKSQFSDNNNYNYKSNPIFKYEYAIKMAPIYFDTNFPTN